MTGAVSQSSLNTLLPPARVHVFSTDEDTADVFLSLQGDWRFGRVAIERYEGGIDTAVEKYATAESPDVLIIQTADISETFQAKLSALAQVCDEHTSALLIGPVNDVQLYRKLTSMGISDYLVTPVSLFVMAEAVARTLLRMLGATGSKLIAVVGAKGGLGVTNMAQLIARTAAEQFKCKTLLMDAAAGQSTLWAQFGTTPTGSLTEASRAAVDKDHDTLSRILVALDETLTFMNTGAEPILDTGSARQMFELMLERMLAQYPLVVVDLSSTTNGIKSSVLGRAQGVFVVTTPMVQSLSLAKTLLGEIRAMRGNDASDIRLVLNKTGEHQNCEVSSKDIAATFGVPVALEVPYQPKLFLRAESEAQQVADYAEGKTLSKSLVPHLQNLLHLVPEGANPQADKTAQAGVGALWRKLKGGA